MSTLLKSSPLDRALGRAAEGRGISSEDARLLYEQCDLRLLFETAGSLRGRFHGHTVSFSKKVFIPLTTLCRDRCGYCTFRKDPGDPGGRYMTPEEVLELARAGRAAGCKEALFSLGDQPERVFAEARDFLLRSGYRSTLEYLAAMSELVLEEVGLLPHSNPGLMNRASLEKLKESNISLGLMLENASLRLMRKGGPHWQAPDKTPRRRIETIEEAGKLRIAFTTGILIGIGETLEERIDSLLAIRSLQESYGHIQEVIVQNFRAKTATPMAGHPDLPMEEMLRTLALARLMLPGEINLQAPPNLSMSSFPLLLQAGINDWGGISPVTKDFINPEAAWPQIALLHEKTAQNGLTLRERLAIYPEYAMDEGFVHDRLRPYLQKLVGEDGYAHNGGS